MMQARRKCVLLCALVGVLAPACAGGSDARSQQLVSITHITAPNGVLSISEDGSYAFVDSKAQTETKGALMAGELADVQAHVSKPRLDALYEHRSLNQDACGATADGYVLSTSVGTACLVASELTDATAQSELSFYTQLFQAKSVHP